MSDAIGGYIYFPKVEDRAALIRLLLQAIEVSPDDQLEIWLPDGEDTNPTDLPSEQALSELAFVNEGAIYLHSSRMLETGFWFELPVKGYQTINVWGDDYTFSERSHVSDQQLDTFVERWIVLCEQGKADFGYFGRYMQMVEKPFRDQLLPALLRKDISSLLYELPSYWLVYLGPELAEHWRQEKMPLSILPLASRSLPSGAQFFRTTSRVFG